MKALNSSAVNALTPRPLLCGHDQPMILSGAYKAVCPVCRSFWDRDSLKARVDYDRSYPELRSHFDPDIGAIKVRTLHYWLKKNHVRIEHLAVCEVGFGGGFCLPYLSGSARQVYGIEAVPENIDHAIQLGMSPASLFRVNSLPAALPSQVDLWIFQDSFEHLDDPQAFTSWLVKNSSLYAKILIVAPDGSCISEKIMGRWWPHKVRDHRFHWSRKGLVDFFSRNGFVVEGDFSPLKFVTLKMIMAHLLLKAGRSEQVEKWKRRLDIIRCIFLFNVGEMGLLLKRNTR
jgi:hypothetical protein